MVDHRRDDEEWTHGELRRAVERIADNQDALRANQDALLKALAREYVSVPLWLQRNALVDRELATIKARPQWTAVASALVSVATLLVVLMRAL